MCAWLRTIYFPPIKKMTLYIKAAFCILILLYMWPFQLVSALLFVNGKSILFSCWWKVCSSFKMTDFFFIYLPVDCEDKSDLLGNFKCFPGSVWSKFMYKFLYFPNKPLSSPSKKMLRGSNTRPPTEVKWETVTFGFQF